MDLSATGPKVLVTVGSLATSLPSLSMRLAVPVYLPTWLSSGLAPTLTR